MFPTAFTDLVGLDLPLVQAPMATVTTPELVAAVSDAGALGSLACGLLTPEEIGGAVTEIRRRTSRPFALNFLCHLVPAVETETLERWEALLAPYYEELGVTVPVDAPPPRGSFDEAACEAVEAVRPSVVSFHYGLPAPELVQRVRATGCQVLSSATTVAEARWLVAHGCDAVIAQGAEAGGHRGMFLTDDLAAQVGTMALVPQMVDAVDVPVLAAGGIGDARGIVAAIALGASAVQLGTAYLRTPEAALSPLFRSCLESADDETTVLTNVFTGRPARGLGNRLVRELGPVTAEAPPFPLAAVPVAPLRAAAEQAGSSAFSTYLFGQSVALARAQPAGELTRALAREAADLLLDLASPPPPAEAGGHDSFP